MVLQEGVAKLLDVVIMPGIKESLKDFSSQDHILTEVFKIRDCLWLKHIQVAISGYVGETGKL